MKVSQERHLRPHPRDVTQVERRRHQRLLEYRAFDDQVAPRPRDQRPTHERLATLEPDEVRQRHVDTVLAGDILHDPFPATNAHRPLVVVSRGLQPARRTGTRHDQHLGAIEGRNSRHDGVPRIFADQQCRAAPARVEGLHAVASGDEALLVEHAVRWQEHLAVHMPYAGVTAAERRVQRRVVDVIAVPLVEAERHVQVGCATFAMHPGQVVEEPLRLHGEIADAALQEVSGERALGTDDEAGWCGKERRFAEHLAQPGKILGVAALSGPELGQRDGQHRSVESKLAARVRLTA